MKNQTKITRKTFDSWLTKALQQALTTTYDDCKFDKEQSAKFNKQFFDNFHAIIYLKKLKFLKKTERSKP